MHLAIRTNLLKILAEHVGQWSDSTGAVVFKPSMRVNTGQQALMPVAGAS
jgi:hypothetical protein